MFETLMKLKSSIDLPILVTTLLAIVLIVSVISVNKESFQTTPSILDSRPILWFVLDDQANTRKWADFGSRISKQNNRGYTQLSYKAAQHTQGKDFQVILLEGRDNVARTIESYGGVVPENIHILPPALWRAYSRAALLANAGGLYADGDSVLFIGPSVQSFLTDSDAILFGVNPDEPIVSGTSADKPGPSPYTGYAKSSKQSAWMNAEIELKKLVEAGSTRWTSAIANRTDQKIMEFMRESGVKVIRQAEGNRKKDGTYLNLYDLFARVPSIPDKQLTFEDNVAYVSFDSDLLERSAQLSFILKLSENQLNDSDFLFVRLVKKALNH
jgi:hypothetical protein